MPGMKIDFSAVSEATFIEPGMVPVSIGKVTMKEASDHQSHFFQFDLTVADGPSEGSSLVYRCSLKQNVLWRLKRVLRSLGYSVDGTMNFEVDEDSGLLVEPMLVGTVAMAQVYTDTYNGEKRSAVQSLFGMDDEEGIAAAAKELEETNGTLIRPAAGTPAIAVTPKPAAINGAAKPATPAVKAAAATGGLKLK